MARTNNVPLTKEQGEMLIGIDHHIKVMLRKYAPHITHSDYHYDELFSDCMLMVCKGIRRYSRERGDLFYYLTNWIRSAISRYWRMHYAEKRIPKSRLRTTGVRNREEEDESPSIDLQDYREELPERLCANMDCIDRYRRMVPDRNWEMLYLHYVMGYTLEEVAKKVVPRTSKQRAYQLIQAAMEQIKRNVKLSEMGS